MYIVMLCRLSLIWA